MYFVCDFRKRKNIKFFGSHLTNSITAFLDRNLSYQSLLDALHKSKLFYNHHNRLRDVDGLRSSDVFPGLVGESDAIRKLDA